MKKENNVIRSGKYLRLVIQDGWEYIERVNCSGVVIVVSETPDGNVVLVEQFRRPVQQHVIGFPAGLVGDDAGKHEESFVEAAKREMLEETGYLPAKIKTFFIGPVNAGMCRDMITIVHATGLKKVGQGGGKDAFENIRIHEVPRGQADGWLRRKAKSGVLVGPNVFAGLYFLEHWVK